MKEVVRMKKRLLALLLTFVLIVGCCSFVAFAEGEETRPDIVILFTSDVHCGIDQGFGYAGLEQIRDGLVAQGNVVILVDDGDNIQGEPIGTMTKGEALVELMNEAGYEIAIPGNHEFDYGMEQFLSLTEKAKFQYIS